MTQRRFPKSSRLVKSEEFDRVFSQRCSAADDMIIVYAARSSFSGPRLGMVVSRKCGNAVFRNQWKRSLREAFRLTQHKLPRQLDLVVLPCRGAAPNVRRLQNSLKDLALKNAAKLPARETKPEDHL